MKAYLLFKYYQLLGYYARTYLKKWQPLVIGINGSVGKTSCRMIVDEVLQAHLGDQLKIYTSPKNFNGELGMSLSIFQITERTPSITGMRQTLKKIRALTHSDVKPYDVIILEYGIDRPQEMEFLCSIIKPHISILTKLDAVHSLQFGDAEAIAAEELKLQKNTLLQCYINTSDPHGTSLAPKLKTKVSYYDTSSNLTTTKETTNHIMSTDYSLSLSSAGLPLSHSTLHYRQKETSFRTNVTGKIHHDYVALAYDIVENIRNQYNLKPITMKTELKLELQPGRMSIFQGIQESIIIDSSYNSSPLSLRKIIEESNEIQKKLYPDTVRIYILGDMRELGESETHHHTELAEYLYKTKQPNDYIILLGQAMKTTYDTIINETGGMKTKQKNLIQNKIQKREESHIYHVLSFQEASIQAKKIIALLYNNNKKSFVIVKGSQNTIFLEEVVKSLLQNSSDIPYLTRQGSRREHKKGIKNYSI